MTVGGGQEDVEDSYPDTEAEKKATEELRATLSQDLGIASKRRDVLMPEFTITRQIEAPVEKVWEVLNDFGDVQRWSPGVTGSELTSDGPVSEGSTRHCYFAPIGGVNERIDRYEPNERMTVNLFETAKLPISGAVADFNIGPHDDGTKLTLHYSYTPNLLGRLLKGYTDKQMRKGIGGMAKALQRESERIAAS